MPRAEIIAIGTELLLGEIQDTNTRWIARQLREAGIDIFRATIVGDNSTRIAQSIREALDRCEILITTGGLGPTVDDPTREAVALATNSQLVFQADLWLQIQQRFKRFGRPISENNRQQAYIPSSAVAIENPVGTAPAFYVELGDKVIISLPGVPREMEALMDTVVMPLLKQKFQLQGGIYVHTLHLAGIGESKVDELIADLERLTNPTVGLMAHPGLIDVRITAKAGSPGDAEVMIRPIEQMVRNLVGEYCFGSDGDTLQSVVAGQLQSLGYKPFIVEAQTNGELTRTLSTVMSVQSQQLDRSVTVKELGLLAEECRADDPGTACIALSVNQKSDLSEITIVCSSPQGTQTAQFGYGGPPANAGAYAANQALNFMRTQLMLIKPPKKR